MGINPYAKHAFAANVIGGHVLFMTGRVTKWMAIRESLQIPYLRLTEKSGLQR